LEAKKDKLTSSLFANIEENSQKYLNSRFSLSLNQKTLELKSKLSITLLTWAPEIF
jgi:hypothetical protein